MIHHAADRAERDPENPAEVARPGNPKLVDNRDH